VIDALAEDMFRNCHGRVRQQNPKENLLFIVQNSLSCTEIKHEMWRDLSAWLDSIQVIFIYNMSILHQMAERTRLPRKQQAP
jgi:hypothetical protein